MQVHHEFLASPQKNVSLGLILRHYTNKQTMHQQFRPSVAKCIAMHGMASIRSQPFVAVCEWTSVIEEECYF